jgi:hypothetical protein
MADLSSKPYEQLLYCVIYINRNSNLGDSEAGSSDVRCPYIKALSVTQLKTGSYAGNGGRPKCCNQRYIKPLEPKTLRELSNSLLSW